MKIKKAFGQEDDWKYNYYDEAYSTVIPQLNSGKTRNFVLELEVGPNNVFQE